MSQARNILYQNDYELIEKIIKNDEKNAQIFEMRCRFRATKCHVLKTRNIRIQGRFRHL